MSVCPISHLGYVDPMDARLPPEIPKRLRPAIVERFNEIRLPVQILQESTPGMWRCFVNGKFSLLVHHKGNNLVSVVWLPK